MADTAIEWTEKVWNPVTGCTKVSEGCRNCYAERYFQRPYPGRKFTDIVCHKDRLDAPLHWRKPARIFVNSMGDLFHESVPDVFIARVISQAGAARRHTFQILTKRPQRMLDFFSRCRADGLGWITHNGAEIEGYGGDGIAVGNKERWPTPNIWLGVSVENQATVAERIPLLLQTPAALRWVSAEPLLGPLNIAVYLGGDVDPSDENREDPGIDWVVCGGESGPRARPMSPDWARSLRDQCQAAHVPFFFKQWGEWLRADCGFPVHVSRLQESKFVVFDIDGEQEIYARVGKRAAGRLLDGREWNEYPEVQRG